MVGAQALLPTADDPARVLLGDALDVLRRLPDECAQVCCTSPPYWGLRDYGTATWVGGDPACQHKGRPKPRQDTDSTRARHGQFARTRGAQLGKAGYSVPVREKCRCGAKRVDRQIGLETSPDQYVARLVEVFHEVRRVLRPDGTLWLNLGDCYAHDGKGGGETGGLQAYLPDADRKRNGRSKRRTGLKPKDLVGIPWTVAFALRADGWHLRSGIPWIKRNPLPESIKDRPSTALEYVFLLSKGVKAFYDREAVKLPVVATTRTDRPHDGKRVDRGYPGVPQNVNGLLGDGAMRLRRNTDWFFESWQGLYTDAEGDPLAFVVNVAPYKDAHFACWPPRLVEPMVLAGSRRGDLVLDPFAGSGTTLSVAVQLGRLGLGIELNPAYGNLAEQRLARPLGVGGLFRPTAPVVRSMFDLDAGEPAEAAR